MDLSKNFFQLKGNAGSKRQHVHGCSLVRARKFYGYHSSEELFLKIYLYPTLPNVRSFCRELIYLGSKQSNVNSKNRHGQVVPASIFQALRFVKYLPLIVIQPLWNKASYSFRALRVELFVVFLYSIHPILMCYS